MKYKFKIHDPPGASIELTLPSTVLAVTSMGRRPYFSTSHLETIRRNKLGHWIGGKNGSALTWDGDLIPVTYGQLYYLHLKDRILPITFLYITDNGEIHYVIYAKYLYAGDLVRRPCGNLKMEHHISSIEATISSAIANLQFNTKGDWRRTITSIKEVGK